MMFWPLEALSKRYRRLNMPTPPNTVVTMILSVPSGRYYLRLKIWDVLRGMVTSAMVIFSCMDLLSGRAYETVSTAQMSTVFLVIHYTSPFANLLR